jgi:hypothetical protein
MVSEARLQAEKAVSRLSARQALSINASRGSATKGKRKGGRDGGGSVAEERREC